jgi:uncharacterized protein YraI
MRRYLLPIAAALLASAALPSVAAAANAEVTTDLNMRAGPSTSFPVVEVIPDDANVTVHGCVSGYGWCDVTWRSARGWVHGDYLRYFYSNRYIPLTEYATIVDVPIVTFSVDTYWDSYYRNRPWYGRRAYWRDVWRDNRRDIREDRREDRADRRRDRREDRAERREERRDARQDRRRENRAERRQERRENRAERRERRRDAAQAERRRENRAERRQQRRQPTAERRQQRRDARVERRRENRVERRQQRRENRVERRQQRRDMSSQRRERAPRAERGGQRGRGREG